VPRKNEDLLILLSAGIIAGSASILIRYSGPLNFFTIAFYRLLIAALAVWVIALPSRRIKIPRYRELGLLVLSGVFLGLHFIAFTYAVQFTSVSNATFLGDLGPVFVVVMSPVVLLERITRREIGFVSLALLGSLLSGSVGGSSILLPSLSQADLVAVLAAFLAANYTVIGRLLRDRVEWFTYIAIVYLVATVVVGGVTLGVFGVTMLSLTNGNLYALVALGLLPTFGGHSLYNLALRRVKAVRANLMLLLEPIIASVLAFVLFSQAPTYLQEIGYTLIALSIFGVGIQLSKSTLQAKSK
jgi:drug/metabolite transporter (DMT)-like permease